MLESPLAIVVVLFATILVSLLLVDRYVWAQRASAVMLILFLSALASNLGLIPTASPLYEALVDLAVPFAVCVILLKVDLADVLKAGRAMIVAFGIASVGTMVGVLVAGLVLAAPLARILGDEAWKVAGPYTGTYIGGSLNFFALWSGLEIGRPDLFAAANAVDNLTLFPLFAIWILVPTMLGARFPVAGYWHLEAATEEPAAEQEPRLLPTQIVALVFTAFAIILLSGWIKTAFVDRFVPQVPTILIVTTLALAAGQVGPIKRLEGAWELGHLAFYIFFAAVGAMINLYNAVVLAPILFAYVMIIIVVHMLVIYGVGRVLKMDVAVLTIASTATKAGPPMVLAMTEIKGWKHLALPGVLMGLLGYAVGNYAGFAVAYLMRALL